MSIATISKFETLMKEHEKELLDTNIDMKIEKFKSEVSNSINNTFSTLNSNNSPSFYNQSSDDIIKWTLLKSPCFHSHVSQLT